MLKLCNCRLHNKARAHREEGQALQALAHSSASKECVLAEGLLELAEQEAASAQQSGAQAGELSFSVRNETRDSLEEIDLHGLTVAQAVACAQNAVNMHRGGACRLMTLICGWGRASAGDARIKPAVIEAMKKCAGVSCVENPDNPGVLDLLLDFPATADPQTTQAAGTKRKKNKKNGNTKQTEQAVESEEEYVSLMVDDPEVAQAAPPVAAVNEPDVPRMSKAQKRKAKLAREQAANEAEEALELAASKLRMVSQCMEMGFSEIAVRAALESSGWRGSTIALEALLIAQVNGCTVTDPVDARGVTAQLVETPTDKARNATAAQKVTAVSAGEHPVTTVRPPPPPYGHGLELADAMRDLLVALSVGHLAPLFETEQIDISALLLMTDQDMKQLQIAKGPRMKLSRWISAQSAPAEDAPAAVTVDGRSQQQTSAPMHTQPVVGNQKAQPQKLSKAQKKRAKQFRETAAREAEEAEEAKRAEAARRQMVSDCIEMGFSEQQVYAALDATGWCGVQAALTRLLG